MATISIEREFRDYCGTYRDIKFEIRSTPGYTGELAWTFYLIILLQQLPESLHSEVVFEDLANDWGRVWQNYSASPLINSLDWHGGCTYYEKHYTDAGVDGIKVGCDYSHCFDEGRHYTVEYVLDEVAKCIDSLHEVVVQRTGESVLGWCLNCGHIAVQNGVCADCKATREE